MTKEELIQALASFWSGQNLADLLQRYPLLQEAISEISLIESNVPERVRVAAQSLKDQEVYEGEF